MLQLVVYWLFRQNQGGMRMKPQISYEEYD